MPAGDARRGRRGNGLVAQDYAVVGDVDPRIGEHLLDVLGARGIAAYLQPATDLHPITRTTTLPARPTDRLFVDRRHLSTARTYLAQVSPAGGRAEPSAQRPDITEDRTDTEGREAGGRQAGGREAGDDEAFAQIVAGFHVAIDPIHVPWPEAENVDAAGTAAVDMDTEPGPRSILRRASDTIDQASLLDGLDTFGANLPDEEDPDGEEGYTPPPAPPLPRVSPAAGFATVGIVVGLMLFFWPSLLPIQQNVTLFLAFAAVLAGFVTLIWRLRPGDEDDDDYDDGARV